MRYVIICLALIAFASCKKHDVIVAGDSSDDYFPTLNGHWVIYNVDSIVHLDNDNNTDDSIHYFHFQIKELIASTFIDGEGRSTQRIERYKKDNDTTDWYITNVWTSNLLSNRAERNEDNVRYIALAFPINGNITWNRNAFNTLGEVDYTYESFHVPDTLNNFSFDSTLTVVPLQPDTNFVEQNYFSEIYAVHVGRIYQINQALLKNGVGQIVTGLDYRETVASYGNN